MTRKPDADAVLDVLVGGGGYVGLSLGVALKQADPALSVAVVDMRPREAMAGDPRASTSSSTSASKSASTSTSTSLQQQQQKQKQQQP